MTASRNVFKYKSFEGSMEFSHEDQCLCGQVLFVRDSIIFHAENYRDLKQAFEDAVDQYLDDCKDLGREANKPCTGSFNVRIGETRHRAISSLAWKKSRSINSMVCEAVDQLLINDGNQVKSTHVNFNISMIQEVSRKESNPWSTKSTLRLVQ